MGHEMKKYYKYGAKEINWLKSRDIVLGRAMEQFGMVNRAVEPDLFVALIKSIISQQISTKAAATVAKRLSVLSGGITPEKLAVLGVEKVQQCGVSQRKAGYILKSANAVLSGALDLQALHKLSDADVIKELSRLAGIGRWTAEMLLIHSLQRPDVVSFDDLGIRRGMMLLYGLEALSREKFQFYRERYAPYGTVASIYLWYISSLASWQT